MKKKIISLLLVFVAAFACAFTLPACSGMPIEDVYKNLKTQQVDAVDFNLTVKETGGEQSQEMLVTGSANLSQGNADMKAKITADKQTQYAYMFLRKWHMFSSTSSKELSSNLNLHYDGYLFDEDFDSDLSDLLSAEMIAGLSTELSVYNGFFVAVADAAGGLSSSGNSVTLDINKTIYGIVTDIKQVLNEVNANTKVSALLENEVIKKYSNSLNAAFGSNGDKAILTLIEAILEETIGVSIDKVTDVTLGEIGYDASFAEKFNDAVKDITKSKAVFKEEPGGVLESTTTTISNAKINLAFNGEKLSSQSFSIKVSEEVGGGKKETTSVSARVNFHETERTLSNIDSSTVKQYVDEYYIPDTSKNTTFYVRDENGTGWGNIKIYFTITDGKITQVRGENVDALRTLSVEANVEENSFVVYDNALGKRKAAEYTYKFYKKEQGLYIIDIYLKGDSELVDYVYVMAYSNFYYGENTVAGIVQGKPWKKVN